MTQATPQRAAAPVLGILGGMGPRSTAPFLELVLDACERRYGARDDIDFPLMMVCSMPVPFVPQAASHDAEAEFLAVREGLQRLDTPDTGVLAIACNTAHVHHARLASDVRAPLLDMVQISADALRGDAAAGRIAVLCSRPTAESDLYPARLREAGLEVVPVDWQADVDALLELTRRRPEPAVLRDAWGALQRRAAAAGADTVLVACLDLSGVIAQAPAASPRLVDAAALLADALVRHWLVSGGGRATDPGSVHA